MQGQAEQTPSTRELALTEASYSAIAAQSPRWRRVLLYVAGVVLALLGLFSLAGGAETESESDTQGVALVFLVVGVFLLGSAIWGSFKARRARMERNFLRTTGPLAIKVEENPGSDYVAESTSYALELFDRRFYISAGVAKSLPAALPWATVDYTKDQETVFEVRDAESRSLYRHPAYVPPS